MLTVAGGLGFAGIGLGLVNLCFCCAGFEGALYFSPAVIALGVVAFILTTFAMTQSSTIHPNNESRTIACLCLSILCIIGGILEVAVLMQSPLLLSQAR